MILLIDNYDSFTWNIYQVLSTLTDRVEVARNDRFTPGEIERMPLTHLVISPGPGRPDAAGVSEEAIRRLAGRVPILGVCLGHQAIGEVFGGKVVHAGRLMHGKPSSIRHRGDGIFARLPNPFEAIRYHSLAVERATLPAELEVTAEAEDGEIMGVRHRRFNVEGVQFHPESFGTDAGEILFANFLQMKGGARHDA